MSTAATAATRATRSERSADDRETRDRLLKAAQHLFADRGFKDVTVREICHAARANVAAVNYHFGDKLGLYREVLSHAIDAMREATETARRLGEGKSPDEQLRVYISVFLHRVLAPDADTIHRLVHREAHEPTPALDDIVEQGVRPRIEFLSRIVADIIGCEPTDPRVFRCVGSLQSQSIMYARFNPIAERLGFRFGRTPAEIDEAADHIATFSLAGIRAIGRSRSPRQPV